MPFTFSHPAAVLPLYAARRKWFSLTALVMGSIAPDFEYYFSLKKGLSHYSHTPPALLWFNLPLALALCFIFHGLVRQPLIRNLPLPLFKRFSPYLPIQWMPYFKSHWTIVIASAIIGSITHLLWDKVLHFSGDPWSNEKLVKAYFLNREIGMNFYRAFHIINSAIGVVLIAAVIWRMEPYPAKRIKDAAYWPAVFLVSLLITGLRHLASPLRKKDDMLVVGIAALMAALVFVSAYYCFRKNSRAKKADFR